MGVQLLYTTRSECCVGRSSEVRRMDMSGVDDVIIFLYLCTTSCVTTFTNIFIINKLIVINAFAESNLLLIKSSMVRPFSLEMIIQVEISIGQTNSTRQSPQSDFFPCQRGSRGLGSCTHLTTEMSHYLQNIPKVIIGCSSNKFVSMFLLMLKTGVLIYIHAALH
jgi:hypothetical protein